MKLEDILVRLENNTDNYLESFKKGVRLTKNYSEIYDDTLKLLSFLSTIKVKRGERIGILGSNSYEYIILDLACVLGGFISVPFHEKDFQNEVEDLCVRYDLSLIFLDDKYIKERMVNSISLNSLVKLINDCVPDKQLIKPINEDEVFTLIFTSGTTGFPKGIEVKACGASDFVKNLDGRFEFTKGDKFINFFPLSVFTSRLYIFGAILLRFNMVLSTPDILIESLMLSQPTILQGVPYLFETIYDSIYQGIKASFTKYVGFRIYLLMQFFLPIKVKKKIQNILFKEIYNLWGGKMRVMFTGSAPISKKVISFFNDVGMELYEAYGTNETGLVAINCAGAYKIGSVGKPFSNKEVLIDDNGEILVKGEFCWGTNYVCNSADTSGQVFQKDGFIATGDQGYIDKDGFLYINGRIKDIIILSNGEKVHPSIIENGLKNSQYIKQVVAIGDNRPFITCIIVKSEESITIEQLDKEISLFNKNIPSYLHVKSFVVADQPFTISNLLLNTNMKINRTLIEKTYKDRIEQLYF